MNQIICEKKTTMLNAAEQLGMSHDNKNHAAVIYICAEIAATPQTWRPDEYTR